MTNHYIRSGASGANTGANWTDAFSSMPSGGSMVRGDVYYIADGTYTGTLTCNQTESSTSVITIKKATVADHGTATGWSDAYGDGQAIIAGQVLISSGYWTFDGQACGADESDGSLYGIRITETTGNFACIRMTTSGTMLGLTFQYLDLLGPSRTDPLLAESAIYAYNASGRVTFTASHCHTSLVWPDVFTIKGDNITIENCYIDQNFSTPGLHGQIVAHHDCDNVTFRFNKVRNPWGTAVYTVIGNGQTNTGLKIYGNIIWQTTELLNPDGISAFVEVIQTATLNNSTIHNNTLVNVGYNPRIIHVDNTGSGRVAYNNLWYDCGTGESVTHSNWTVDYSWYYSTTHDAEAHEQFGASGVFRSIVGEDFGLTSGTTAGITLASPYDIDINGTTRALDGTWDRGAYEYTTPPAASLPGRPMRRAAFGF